MSMIYFGLVTRQSAVYWPKYDFSVSYFFPDSKNIYFINEIVSTIIASAEDNECNIYKL